MVKTSNNRFIDVLINTKKGKQKSGYLIDSKRTMQPGNLPRLIHQNKD
jgi:hypothetical protein